MIKTRASLEFFVNRILPLHSLLSSYFGENNSDWRMRKSAEGFGIREHTTQIAISFCDKVVAFLLCKLAASLIRQESMFIKSLQQVIANDEVTMRRTCSKLVMQVHCKLVEKMASR
ncbi:hypothetical protein AVEN_161987-1 [Araneus ventricosus]|uniref:Uncharacterized protein n=1 Tax=Araneus ventricosus TaxID=182803 RepID=A0A4Y2P450_ARAVE|nr:hypothetical protein AVEN_25084-1 [Araneus ventricosus]GBN44786.1 hypothetical protein AVEN_161987-1 [Araneus ventricosus]